MFNILKLLKASLMRASISYALDANQYPASPESTAVPARANSTQAASISSFEVYDNSELEVISIARGRTPFLHTLTSLGRGLNWGSYKTIWVNEEITTNFPEHKWYERDEFNDIFDVNVNANSAATSITFVSTAGLYAGLVLRNPTTNEQMRITSITSATIAVLERAVGTVAAAAIVAATDNFVVLGSASEKGQASLNSFYVANQIRSNYFQKFLTTSSQDDFDSLSNKIGWGEKLITEKSIQHALEIEKAMLFGQKKASTDPTTGKIYYTMEWLIENCKRGWTNDISGALTRITLEEALQWPLKYSKDWAYKKLVVCGSKVKSVISALFESRLQTTQIKDIDLTFDSIKINQGTFMFVEHPMLDSDSGYENIMFITDPSFLKVVYPTGKNPVDNVGMNGKTRFIINQATKTFAFCEFSLVTYMTMENSNSNAFWAITIVA